MLKICGDNRDAWTRKWYEALNSANLSSEAFRGHVHRLVDLDGTANVLTRDLDTGIRKLSAHLFEVA